jgi:hypothetical protein
MKLKNVRIDESEFTPEALENLQWANHCESFSQLVRKLLREAQEKMEFEALKKVKKAEVLSLQVSKTAHG